MLNIDPERIRRKSISALLLFGIVSYAATASENVVPPVTLEAIGHTIAYIDKTEDMLHREAVLDALKNAVLQANPTINSRISLKEMAVQQHDIHIQTSGFAELNQVLESGFITNSAPSTYRVILEATVREHPTVPLLNTITEGSVSAISLNIQSDRSIKLDDSLRNLLAQEFNKRNIQIKSRSEKSDEFTLNVRIVWGGDHTCLELQWDAKRVFSSTAPNTLFLGRTLGSQMMIKPEELSVSTPQIALLLVEETVRISAMPYK